MSGLPQRLVQPLSMALGVAIEPSLARRVGGGDINDAFRVQLPGGPIFVKTHASPPSPRRPDGPTFFAAEALGLGLLDPLPTPRVLAVLDNALVLEWLDAAPETPESAATAGRALAHLHQRTAPSFGLDHDNFMGALVQDNRPASAPDFAAFFRERRLLPFVAHLPRTTARRLETLPLDGLTDSPPTLIHGDLWGGNLMHTPRGPVFIDPAVSYGHPEQDLAMTRLFGGFSPAFYAAYGEVSPIRFDRDLDLRLDVLTLYPLLVHVALFGGSYLRRVEAIVDRFA